MLYEIFCESLNTVVEEVHCTHVSEVQARVNELASEECMTFSFIRIDCDDELQAIGADLYNDDANSFDAEVQFFNIFEHDGEYFDEEPLDKDSV